MTRHVPPRVTVTWSSASAMCTTRMAILTYVEAGAFQDARGCSTGDDERGACAGADAECREAAAHYADERDGARGWSSTDEGGEDFCVNARDDAREWSGTDAGGEDFCDDERDDAREWSGTDEGGEDFYDSDAGFGDARW